MTLTGYVNANFPVDILLDSGVIYIGSTKFGVTKGAPKFTPNRTWDNIGFDGKFAAVKLLDRPVNGTPVISLTAIEFGPLATGNQVSRYEPSSVTSSVTSVVTYTPVAAGALLATGGYLTDLRVIWERPTAGTYFAVYFPFALCTKYELAGVDHGNPTIAAEFEGRLDLSTGAVTDPAYKLEYRSVLP